MTARGLSRNCRARRRCARLRPTSATHASAGCLPRERHDEIVAGKYGIGLLGFWSIGHRMDIRSRVGGGEVWVLRMVEELERAELLRDRMAFESADTFTEVVISEMHDSAQRLLTGRRLNEYIASELRGMLLATGAALEIHDGLARGLAERTFTVVPRRFVGERLALPGDCAGRRLSASADRALSRAWRRRSGRRGELRRDAGGR